MQLSLKFPSPAAVAEKKNYLFLAAGFGLLCLVFIVAAFRTQVKRFSVSGLSANQPIVQGAIVKEPVPELKTDTKTGLTTYLSQSGKFEFSYPSDLKIHVNFVHVQNTQVYHPVANVIELDSPSLGKAPYILIAYGQNLTPSTIHDYVENSSECDDVEGKDGEHIFVGGVPALLYKNITCSDKPETRVYFIKDKMEYTITFSGNPVNEQLMAVILDHLTFVP